jgi:hypothetical protein
VPRIPSRTLADADWLAQTALAVAAEKSFPPPAVAIIDLTGELIVLRRADGSCTRR